MGLHLEVADHTPLSRRNKSLDIKLQESRIKGLFDWIIDCTGLSIVGQGQWAATKHGQRGHQGWK